jgi:hypothetical protein
VVSSRAVADRGVYEGSNDDYVYFPGTLSERSAGGGTWASGRG